MQNGIKINWINGTLGKVKFGKKKIRTIGYLESGKRKIPYDKGEQEK